MNTSKRIAELAAKIQNQINKLYSNQPDNEIFEQEGILTGFQIVREYLDEDENGLAIEHLLYIIYESNISYPTEIIEEINDLSSKYKIKNPYL